MVVYHFDGYLRSAMFMQELQMQKHNMGLLPDTLNCGWRMRRECFPATKLNEATS